MPKNRQQEPSRQRPVSCRFCRTRKLRCSRDTPCSNCVSRGVRCELEDIDRPKGSALSVQEPEILERLQRLEKFLGAQNPEERESTERSLNERVPNSAVSQAELRHPAASSSEIRNLDNDVAWLESIYAEQNSPDQDQVLSSTVAFRVCPLQEIREVKSGTGQSDVLFPASFESSRCVWLPLYAEAQILLEKFLREVHQLPFVTHVPSIPSILDDTYKSLTQYHQVKPGNVILLLSIFATATHTWVENDCRHGLFSTPAEANKQALLWVKALEYVLDVAHRSTRMSIEAVQGTIIVLFVLASLEGITHRCRSLKSMALFLARDLGLHRIDHPSNTNMVKTAQAEIGRRVWWYIAASDWAIAARFPISEGVYSCHLRQMITKKPLNINDNEVYDGMSRAERPLSEPTTMSYSLQRIRLAEISRNLVDRTPLTMAHVGGASLDVIMDIDTELQMLINDIPPFFSMSEARLVETYNLSPTRAADIRHQGHTIYFLIYTQRCRLHLPYLTRGFVDAAYSPSREMCVKSARLIIQSQSKLENSSIAIRFGFSGLVVGVFMASIVLLMDLCVNKSPSQHERQRAEVAEAFRVLENAKNESKTTAKFVDSLMHILRKHKVPPPQIASTQWLRPGSSIEQPQTPFGGELAIKPYSTQSRSETNGASLWGCSSGVAGANNNNDVNMATDESFNDEDLSLYLNELTQSFEQGNDVVNFDWENIFSGFESSIV